MGNVRLFRCFDDEGFASNSFMAKFADADLIRLRRGQPQTDPALCREGFSPIRSIRGARVGDPVWGVAKY